MGNSKNIQMINNLNKWKSILQVMGENKEIEIVEDIVKIINANTSEEVENRYLKKESDIDSFRVVLKGINDKDKNIINKYKLKLVNIDNDIEEKWDKLSENQKSKLIKFELNIIYALLYKPMEVKYSNKAKKELISDIDYFIYRKKRNEAIEKSVSAR